MKALIIVILLIMGVYYIDNNACNPKGSAAAKIGWAGHKTCR